jgi:OmpA-OmpF porin, OOP family
MKSIVNTIVGAALLAGAAAHAEGIIVGGSLGRSHYKGDDIGGAATDRSATGIKLYGGYEFTPNLSLEAGYADLGKFNSAAGDVKADALYADIVGTLPIAQGFSALGRLGIASGKLDSSLQGSDRGTGIKVGAGLQYDLDKSLALRGEWERYRIDALGSPSNTDVYSVGVHYRF